MIPPTPTQATPTSTTLPPTTVSLAGPSERNGAALTAYHLDQAPVIDGSYSEWEQSGFEIKSIVFGETNYTGASDLWASAHLGWDSQYLYLGLNVVDDTYVQNATGDQIFKGDSIEILLDVQVAPDYYQTSLSEDDYQLGLSPGKGQVGTDSGAWLWYPHSRTGAFSEVKIAAQKTQNGYTLEAAVPWSIFGISPQSGQHYGFALSISDNDNPDENVQQSMISTASGRDLFDPTTWGDLLLQ